MSASRGFQQTLPDLLSKAAGGERAWRASDRSWERPTYSEFLRQIRHEFGDAIDLSPLDLARADCDERLSPGSVRAMCDLLGVPPEDFGV